VPWHELSVGDRVEGAAPPHPVVCIPVYGAHGLFKRCLASVVRWTPPNVPLLIADDADPDEGARRWVRVLASRDDFRHTIWWMRQSTNQGFPANVNSAFAASGRADVVVLNSDCAVAEGWLQGLRDAAYVDEQIASATALTNAGSIVSVPFRNHPVRGLPPHVTFEQAAERVRASTARLRPRLPTAVGHCVYVRRTALDLVGDFDEAFSPGYGEEVDFSQRCIAAGLQHVLADDVLVLHRGGASLSVAGTRNPVQEEHEQVIAQRYPWYHPAVKQLESDIGGPLSRALTLARRAILRPTVTIDGRCLTPVLTGTQLNVLEFIHALWRTDAVRLRVVTPPDLGDYARDALAGMTGVALAGHDEASDRVLDDVAHRPFQVSRPHDLTYLRSLGERLVITHLDLIAYRNPSYFPAWDAWNAYRRLTRHALATADLTFFISRHSETDALADMLVPAARSRVVSLGTDHHLTSLQPPPTPPSDAERLRRRPYLLCLGTDFRHKNRLFALRVLAALRLRHGWEGQLVLAGPSVEYGSSEGDEAAWSLANPAASESVVRLPAVTEREKLWLLRHAAALVYPSTYEGFGFVPFEAAAEGTPPLFAHTSALAETLADATAILVPWDSDATADRAISVLRSAERARELVAEVAACSARYRWATTAQEAIAAYEEVVRMPSPMAARIGAEGAAMEAERLAADARYWHLWNEVGSTGLALVGPQGRLPPDAQRALAALVRNNWTRPPVVGALRAVSRAGRTSRRERRSGDAHA
jgi:glycosyltransferase involved in cell wall biosynthesis